MNETFMKEKPVLPLLISMSLPMVISMLVNSLYNIVDSFFVAKISEEAMTALSLVYPVQNFINAVAIGFGVGINAVIAYHLGRPGTREGQPGGHLGICFVPDTRGSDDGRMYCRHAGVSADVHRRRTGDRLRNPLFPNRLCFLTDHRYQPCF